MVKDTEKNYLQCNVGEAQVAAPFVYSNYPTVVVQQLVVNQKMMLPSEDKETLLVELEKGTSLVLL